MPRRRNAHLDLVILTPTLPPEPKLKGSQPSASKAARCVRAGRKGGGSRRRGSTNPSTSERIYESDEWEFIAAMDRFMADQGKQFPTWSDALGVLKSLGYAKQPKPCSA